MQQFQNLQFQLRRKRHVRNEKGAEDTVPCPQPGVRQRGQAQSMLAEATSLKGTRLLDVISFMVALDDW